MLPRKKNFFYVKSQTVLFSQQQQYKKTAGTPVSQRNLDENIS